MTTTEIAPLKVDRIQQAATHQPRSVRKPNVRFLLGAFITLAIVAPTLYFWHEFQVQRLATALLARSAELEAGGEYKSATDSLYQYLQIHPDNGQALARMANAIGRDADSDGRKSSAIRWYYRALAFNSDSRDLRIDLATLLLDLEQFGPAKDESDRVLASNPDDYNAGRISALATFGQYWKSRRFTLDAAITALHEVHQRNPADVQVAEALIDAYREHKRVLPDSEEAQQSDAIMNQMVQSDSENPRVYLARHRYRQKYKVKGAWQDVVKALKFAPTDTEVLLAAADYTLEENDIVQAREFFRQVVSIAPEDPRGYVGLGKTYARLGDGRRALMAWYRGLKRSDSSHLALHLLAIGSLIADKQFSQARQLLDRLDRIVVVSATLGKDDERSEGVTGKALLEGKWHLAQGKCLEAISYFKEVASTASGGTDFDRNSEFEIEAWILLASTYESLGRWYEAANCYDQLLKKDAKSLSFLLLAGKAWAAAGDFGAATWRCQQALALEPTSRDALILSCRTLLEQQRRLLIEDRDWTPLATTLAAAEKQVPDSWELSLVKAELVLLRDGEAVMGRALQILWLAESTFGQSREFWQQNAKLYEQWGRTKEADRALERYQSLVGDTAAAAILRTELLSHRRRFSRANDVLKAARAADRLGRDRRALAWVQARMHWRDANDQIYETLVHLHESAISESIWLKRLAELSLIDEDLADAEKWETKLRQVEGEKGIYWRYYRARRLLMVDGATTASTAEVIQLSEEINRLRPRWSNGAVLSGLIHQKVGDIAQAIDALQMAVALGARQEFVAETISRLLYQSLRFLDAYQFLNTWKRQQPLPDEMAILPVAVVSYQDQAQRLVHAARQSVHRDSNNVWNHVWLGTTLWLVGQLPEAERSFSAVFEKNPQSVMAWAGLWSFYHHVGDEAAAQRAIQRAKGLATELSPNDLCLATGQAYELTGQRDAALRLYKKGLERDAKHWQLIIRRASLLNDLGHVEVAETALRSLQTVDPNNEQVTKTLSALFNRKQLPAETIELREEDAFDQLRLSAIVALHDRTIDGVAKARALLEQIVQTSEHVTSEDRLLLVQLYEREAKIDQARQIAIQIISDKNVNAAHLAKGADFLLRHGPMADAEESLRQLEAQTARNIVSLGLRARWYSQAGREQEIEPHIESFVNDQISELNPEEIEGLLLSVADLYAQLNRNEAAERWYRELVQHFPSVNEPLAMHLLRNGRSDEALQLCLTWNNQDNGLYPAILLAHVMLHGQPSDELAAAGDRFLSGALLSYPNSDELLFAISSLRIQQGRVAEATELLNDVTVVNPGHFLAWNNLAAIIAEQDDQQDEALTCIERAIEAAGYEPATLLDTKATVLLYQGDIEGSVTLLEQATTAPDGDDPRFHFHLSLAYEKAGRDDVAEQSYSKAVRMGLTGRYLTEFEKSQITRMEQKWVR